jgi:hypothetical protein
MSHLAHHVGKPKEAVGFAQRGRTVAGEFRQPEIEARLLAMQARGLAALHRSQESARLLLQAENTLTQSAVEEPSPWVSRFDEGALASEAARCLQQVGDLDQAQRAAERIIALRRGDRRRSRAFGQLMLAAVLVQQGKLEQACAVAQEILDTTQELGSYLVIQQIFDLKRRLERYRLGNKVVQVFLPCLEEVLSGRLCRYQWLTPDRVAEA